MLQKDATEENRSVSSKNDFDRTPVRKNSNRFLVDRLNHSATKSKYCTYFKIVNPANRATVIVYSLFNFGKKDDFAVGFSVHMATHLSVFSLHGLARVKVELLLVISAVRRVSTESYRTRTGRSKVLQILAQIDTFFGADTGVTTVRSNANQLFTLGVSVRNVTQKRRRHPEDAVQRSRTGEGKLGQLRLNTFNQRSQKRSRGTLVLTMLHKDATEENRSISSKTTSAGLKPVWKNSN